MRPFHPGKADPPPLSLREGTLLVRQMHGDEGQSPSPSAGTGCISHPPPHTCTRNEEMELRFWWTGSPWSQTPCFRCSERSRIWLTKGLEFIQLCVFDLAKQCYLTSVLLARRENRSMYFSNIHCKRHTSMFFIWHLCLCVSSTRAKVLTKVSARSFR